MKLQKIVLIIFSFFLIKLLAFSDKRAYDNIITIKEENNIIKVIHFHDWSMASLQKRYDMISGDQNPFSQKNDYSYIECIDKSSKVSLFKKPSSAFSKIEISKDSKYIICLSNIKIYNPYQLVIFNINGDLILKKHIAPVEAKLSVQEYCKFKETYPCQKKLLESLNRITLVGDSIYIDFHSMNMPIWLGKAWAYLTKKDDDSHLSKNFYESVSNWIFWYKDPEPKIKLKYKDKKLHSISFLDPVGERFEITINEQKPMLKKSKKFKDKESK